MTRNEAMKIVADYAEAQRILADTMIRNRKGGERSVMGFNTTVVVLNDALQDIADDPNFGKKLAKAIREMGGRSDKHIDVSAGCSCNAAMVIETHHADNFVVVAVGGNTGVELGHGGPYWSKDDAILKGVAYTRGYYLRKRPKKEDR